MRQDILEELELWPLWTLRGEKTTVDAVMPAVSETKPVESVAKPKAKPSAKAALAQFKQADRETAQSVKQEAVRSEKPLETIAPNAAPSSFEPTVSTSTPADSKQAVASYHLLASEDGRCLLVHDGQPLSQEAIQLRQNMAKAMQLNIKPIQGAFPAAQLFAKYQPAVVVLFGEKTAQTLLDVEEPVADLRGMELVLGDYACVVSYDFNHLLANPKDKRNAWEDLCLALDILKSAA